MGKIKQVEMSYGIKWQMSKTRYETTSIRMKIEVEVGDDVELADEVHATFLQAKKYIETELMTKKALSLVGLYTVI